MAQAGEKEDKKARLDLKVIFCNNFFFRKILTGGVVRLFSSFMTPEKKILAKGFKRKRNGMVEHFWWLDLGIGRLGN